MYQGDTTTTMKGKIINCVKANPGIKAKDIGKKLGVTRREINQVIHYCDCLTQDEHTFGWFLSDTGIIIELPSKWITSYEFEKNISNSEYLNIQQSDLTIVFQENTKLMMDAAARLIPLVNQIADAGKKITLDLTLAKELHSYLNRAGFYGVIHKDTCILPGRPKNNLANTYHGNSQTLVEFKKLDPFQRNNEIPKILSDSLTANFGEENLAVYSFLSEIYNNVYDHVFDLNQTSIHAFAACQTYKRNKKGIRTQIVISDCGSGICNTLRPALKNNASLKKFSSLDDFDLIKTAFSLGKLTRHNPKTDPDHGIGLHLGAQKAKDIGATIKIRQEFLSIELAWKDDKLEIMRTSKKLKPIAGTNICFDFYLD